MSFPYNLQSSCSIGMGSSDSSRSTMSVQSLTVIGWLFKGLYPVNVYMYINKERERGEAEDFSTLWLYIKKDATAIRSKAVYSSIQLFGSSSITLNIHCKCEHPLFRGYSVAEMPEYCFD